MDFNVFRLDVITAEVVEFYKSNLDIAKKQYEELINSAKPRGLDKTVLEGYYEMHHIKARCMGGEDIEDNLVLLTYKEHIIAHMLLFIINPEVIGLCFAFFMLADLKDVRDMDSDLYIDLISLEYIRIELHNSPELKKKQSELAKNRWKDPEYKKRQLEVRKDPEFKKMQSEMNRERWKDPEYKKKQSEVMNSPEYKKKQSEITKNKWKDPEYIKKQSEIRNDPEFKKKWSEMNRERWKDPEYKKKQSEMIKNRWKDPEYKKRQLELHNSPEYKKKQSELAKNRWSDPEFKKRVNYKQCGCISPDNIEYKSIAEASRSLNIPRTTINYWLREGKNGWKRVKKS